VAGLWGCGKRGPFPVSHSPHRLDDDESIIVSTEPGQVQVKAFAIERVLIAYDRDEAGDRAARALSERLAAEGVASYRVLFPKGMDANEYAVKVKPAEQSLAVLLRSAEHMAGPMVTVVNVPEGTSSLAAEEAAAKGEAGDGESAGDGRSVPVSGAAGPETPDSRPSLPDSRLDLGSRDRHHPGGSPLARVIERVCEAEAGFREERRVRTALKLSGLQGGKTLVDSFDFSFQRGVDRRQIELLATAILDRLLHHCHVVQIDGESYRLKDLERRLGSGNNG